MIKLVVVEPGCISCGTCERICPKVFQVKGTSQVVSTDFSDEEKLFDAEASCPVNVIKVLTDDPNRAVASRIQIPARFLQKIQLAPGIFEFYFQSDDINCIPGQFVMLSFKDSTGEFQRSYSIVSFENNILKLCIKIYENGRGSRCLMSLSQGDVLQISNAQGRFVLSPNVKIPKLFVATGTGIAPMISLMKSCPKTPKEVLFGVRNESDIFYFNELAQIPNTAVYYTVSQPSNPKTPYKGRVTDYFDRFLEKGKKEIYLCGNPAMVDDTLKHLTTINYDQNLVFHEIFTQAPVVRKRNFLQRLILDGQIPFFKEFLQLVFYSNLAILLGLPFLPSGFRELGSLGWNILIGILAIRPIAQIFPQLKILNTLMRARREFGILSAVLILAHSYGYFLDGKLNVFTEIFQPEYWSYHGYFFWGILGSIVALVLLITSNKKSVVLLKSWWKRIQKFSYAFFVFGAIHIALINPSRTVEIAVTLLLLTLIRILVYYRFILTFTP